MTGSEPTDEALLREFARTRGEAPFERLVARHWSRAFRIAHGCLHDPAAAEDVAQDVFLKLARASAAELELKATFAGWFHALVQNAVRDRLKVAGRRRRHEERAASARSVVLEERPAAALEAEDLRREVARLPLDVRYAVVLRYLEGHTHEDVARLLACPPGTASSRIRRGLEQLREQLAGAGASVASLSALEASLLGAPTLEAPPPPGLGSLLPRARAAASPLTLGALLLLSTALLGAAAFSVLVGTDDGQLAATTDGPPPRASRDHARAPAAPRGEVPPGEDDAWQDDDGGAASPVAGGANLTDRAAGEPSAPASERAPASTPQGRTRRDVRVRGRVLAAPAMTPVADAELFVVVREVHDFLGASWSSGGRPRGRTGPAGEFELLAAGDETLRDVLLYVRKAGLRPFLRSFPVDAPLDRLEVLLEEGPAPRVHGRVVDEAGAPLAGLTVRVAVPLEGAATGTLLGEGSPPGSSVIDTAQGVIDVVTDAQGRFAAEGLLPLGVTVGLAAAQAHDTLPQRVLAAPDAPELLLVATPTARLVVRVRDADGAAMADALVGLSRADEPTPARWSPIQVSWAPVGVDGLAVFVVPPGSYRLVVGVAGVWPAYERAITAPQHEEVITLAAGEREHAVALSPRDLGIIAVSVRDVSGARVAGRRVWLVPAEREGWLQRLELTTDASGDVEFPELRRGRYRLQAGLERADHGVEVSLEGSRAQAALTTARARAVTGVVLDEAGRPIERVRVRVTARRGGGSRTTWTDAAGRFTGEALTGEVEVSASAPGFQGAEVTDHGDGQPLVLTLVAGRVLVVRGRVDDAVPDGTTFTAGWYGDDSGSTERTQPLVGGQFEVELDGVTTGEPGAVVVRVGEFVPVTRAVSAEQVLVDLGALRLEPGVTIQGRVDDSTGFLADGGHAWVAARVDGDEDRFCYEGTLLPSGRFEVRGLPRVPMVVSFSLASPREDDDRWARADVRVDVRTQTDLGVVSLDVDDDGRGICALLVRVSDPQGALASAGLEDGDVIVGVDGEGFAGRHAVNRALREVALGARAFDVLRGERRLVVSIGPLDLAAAGGDLEPCGR